MIEGQEYIRVVKLFYSFLTTEFGFIYTNATINGNAFFDVEFKKKECIISISYENIENYLEVILFKLHHGKMPDYEDKTKTLNIKQLIILAMKKVSEVEINLNDEYFAEYIVNNEFEYNLLKRAKELRLSLSILHPLAHE